MYEDRARFTSKAIVDNICWAKGFAVVLPGAGSTVEVQSQKRFGPKTLCNRADKNTKMHSKQRITSWEVGLHQVLQQPKTDNIMPKIACFLLGLQQP